MKNTVYGLIFLIFLSVSLLTTCHSRHYADWTTITIPRVGAFQMPIECIITQEDNAVYITDKPINETDYKIYMAGIIFKNGYRYFAPYTLFDDVTIIDPWIEIYLGNAEYKKRKYNISGNIETKYTIIFSGADESIEFIVWDNSLDKKTIKKICNTYEPDKETEN
jgi:hypothetical protein